MLTEFQVFIKEFLKSSEIRHISRVHKAHIRWLTFSYCKEFWTQTSQNCWLCFEAERLWPCSVRTQGDAGFKIKEGLMVDVIQEPWKVQDTFPRIFRHWAPAIDCCKFIYGEHMLRVSTVLSKTFCDISPLGLGHGDFTVSCGTWSMAWWAVTTQPHTWALAEHLGCDHTGRYSAYLLCFTERRYSSPWKQT